MTLEQRPPPWKDPRAPDPPPAPVKRPEPTVKVHPPSADDLARITEPLRRPEVKPLTSSERAALSVLLQQNGSAVMWWQGDQFHVRLTAAGEQHVFHADTPEAALRACVQGTRLGQIAKVSVEALGG